MTYAELCCISNFTFLTGASHPEELVIRAAELGLSAIAVTDRNSLAGVVRAYAALKELRRNSGDQIAIRSNLQMDHSSRQELESAGVARPATAQLPKLIVGARLVLQASPVEWVALPRDRKGYEHLSRLLTLGKRRAEKGDCQLFHKDVLDGVAGMILIALPQKNDRRVADHIKALARRFPASV